MQVSNYIFVMPRRRIRSSSVVRTSLVLRQELRTSGLGDPWRCAQSSFPTAMGSRRCLNAQADGCAGCCATACFSLTTETGVCWCYWLSQLSRFLDLWFQSEWSLVVLVLEECADITTANSRPCHGSQLNQAAVRPKSNLTLLLECSAVIQSQSFLSCLQEPRSYKLVTTTGVIT